MNEAGIESSISESDMKNYVNEVMGEIRKVREAKSSSGNNTL
jgi:hypothetical protein